MNVLVVNAGSSSLKYQLLNTQSGEVFAKGNCERIGIDGSFIGHEEKGAGKSTLEVALPDHRTAIKHVFEILETVDAPVEGIGHRVVQGGWYFPESAVVTDETLAQVREVAPLAPLHNYAEADVIEICRDMFPELGNVIVPDTAFHYNMPERAWRYALPRDVVEKHHVRKYGAHGTSHRFIWRTVNEFMEGKAHKLVSCHLGSGASLCAIEDGHCMDTTMGLTPLDGLVMGTRCGNVDPSAVTFIGEKEQMSYAEVNNMLNKQSGVFGVSGVSSDMRDIDKAYEEGNPRAILARDMYCLRIKKFVGEYAAEMGGVDLIVFTGGVGENSPETRKEVCEGLEFMGVHFDRKINEGLRGENKIISAADSKVKVAVVPTNEELVIATDTYEIVNK